MSDSINLMDYQITNSIPSINFKGQTIVNTINPHSYVVAERDGEFKEALRESDYLLPDGIGIVYAAKWVKDIKIPRITGPDFHLQLLSELEQESKSCFYLGSSERTLSKIGQRLEHEYPNICFETFSPPYKDSFSDEDNQQMVQAINAFNPDVLFIGLTAPKQEKWVYYHKDEINAKVICSIGAAFDFFAGTRRRSSKFWANMGLEWLPRLLREPGRLWRRNLVSTPLFLLEVAKYINAESPSVVSDEKEGTGIEQFFPWINKN